MNYLSHFYIHQRSEAPYFNTGLILPDLARSFVKSFEPLKAQVTINQRALHEGCLQHYQADKLFHNSDFFKWGTAACIAEIKKATFYSRVERKWFIGHILFEMLLDRLLVRHSPGTLTDFYAQLNQADLNILGDYLTLYDVENKERFLQNFDHFRRARYIGSYTDNNLFAYSLSRVLLRVGLPAITFTDKAVLGECVLNLEHTVFSEVYSILLRLKKVFE